MYHFTLSFFLKQFMDSNQSYKSALFYVWFWKHLEVDIVINYFQLLVLSLHYLINYFQLLVLSLHYSLDKSSNFKSLINLIHWENIGNFVIYCDISNPITYSELASNSGHIQPLKTSVAWKFRHPDSYT